MRRDPYFLLFNAITDAIGAIDAMNFGKAKDILIKAQQDGEELWISDEENEAPEE